jgi:hypothetical protein
VRCVALSRRPSVRRPRSIHFRLRQKASSRKFKEVRCVKVLHGAKVDDCMWICRFVFRRRYLPKKIDARARKSGRMMGMAGASGGETVMAIARLVVRVARVGLVLWMRRRRRMVKPD